MQDTTQLVNPNLEMLVAGLVHELNTPLGAMCSAAHTMRRVTELLERSQLQGKAQAALSALRQITQVIDVSSRRIGEVASGLQELERQIGPDPQELAPLDLGDVLRDALSRLELPSRIGLLVVPNSLDSLPAMPVRAQRTRLQNALTTVLQNAIDAIPEQGDVAICLERNGSLVDLWVADNGPGMTETQVAQAVTVGFAERDGRMRLRFGLASSRHIIEAEGGSLVVESLPGSGTHVRVTLPLAA